MNWCALGVRADAPDNFARIHKTLSVTPAMEAGLTMHVWSIEEIVGLFKD